MREYLQSYSSLYSRLFLVLFVFQFSYLGATIHWSSPHLFQLQKANIYSSAVNSQGDAVIGYHNPENKSIEFKGYNFVENQSYPIVVKKIPCQGPISLLKIYLDCHGTLFALWIENGALFASSFPLSSEEGGDWGDVLNIPATGQIHNPTLQCDQKGKAFVIWEQFNGYDFQVYMSSFSNEKQTWLPCLSLSSIGYNCHSTKVASDTAGNIVVIWSEFSHYDKKQSDGLRAVRIRQNGQISEIFSISGSRFILQNPTVSFDKENQVYFVWERKDLLSKATTIQMFSAFSDKETKGNIIDVSEKNGFSPSLVQLSDDFVVFWKTDEGAKEQLQCRSVKNFKEKIHDFALKIPKIKDYIAGCDEYGKVRLVYFSDKQIYVSMYDDKWEEIEIYPIADHEPCPVDNIQLRSDALGNSLITWIQEKHLYYSLGNYLLAPPSFSARRVEKRFPTKTVIRGYLTWAPSTSPEVVGYRIRRDNELLDFTNTGEYVDRRCPRGVVHYSISTINEKGLESHFSHVLLNN